MAQINRTCSDCGNLRTENERLWHDRLCFRCFSALKQARKRKEEALKQAEKEAKEKAKKGDIENQMKLF